MTGILLRRDFLVNARGFTFGDSFGIVWAFDSATNTLMATPKTYTVATLPAATTVGNRAFVTDATSTTFNSIVAGGSTNKVPVFADGTNWRIG